MGGASTRLAAKQLHLGRAQPDRPRGTPRQGQQIGPTKQVKQVEGLFPKERGWGHVRANRGACERIGEGPTKLGGGSVDIQFGLCSANGEYNTMTHAPPRLRPSDVRKHKVDRGRAPLPCPHHPSLLLPRPLSPLRSHAPRWLPYRARALWRICPLDRRLKVKRYHNMLPLLI